MSVTALSSIKPFKDCIAVPLVKKIFTNNWQELLLLGGTLFSVIAAASAFFYGSAALAVSFLICAGINGIGAFYMHKFSALKGLNTVVEKLTEERERLSTVAGNLERENATLSETNRDLKRTAESLKQSVTHLEGIRTDLSNTNQQLRATNADLQRTSQELQATNTQLTAQVQALSVQVPRLTEQVTQFGEENTQLKNQVAQLSTQISLLTQRIEQLTLQVGSLTNQVTALSLLVSQLKASAERIKTEVEHFQTANGALGLNVTGLTRSLRVLDDQITSSRTLCETIFSRLDRHEHNLFEQIKELEKHFRELAEHDSVNQRIQQLASLRTLVDSATQQLTTMKTEYAQERARMEEVRNALSQLRQEFTSLLGGMQSANTTQNTQNQQLQDQVARLSNLLSRYPLPPT